MKEFITVRDLFKENKTFLKLKLLCSENGLNRKIVSGELHRPGLALSGYVDLFSWDRIQILGNTEMSYLEKLFPPDLKKSIDRVMEFEIPLILITSGNKVPPYFLKIAAQRNISIISSPYSTTRFTHLLGDFLASTFAPVESLHGSLVDVYGVGILFTGRSGIGKSEIALDLIERGHRLVADDLVMVKRKSANLLFGYGRDQREHMMEIRGIGLIDIKQIFGIRSIRKQKRVEVQVRLVDWDKDMDYERLGLEETHTEIVGVDIPLIVLPINPGKNITVISETIALNHLLKTYGYHGAREFNTRLRTKMKRSKDSPLADDLGYVEWE